MDVLKSAAQPIELMNGRSHISSAWSTTFWTSRASTTADRAGKGTGQGCFDRRRRSRHEQDPHRAKSHRVETRFAAEPLVVWATGSADATTTSSRCRQIHPALRSIEIWTSKEEGEAVIGIRDNGLGIAPTCCRACSTSSLRPTAADRAAKRPGVRLALAQACRSARRPDRGFQRRARQGQRVCGAPAARCVGSRGRSGGGGGAAVRGGRCARRDRRHPDVADSLVMPIESFGAEVRAAYDGASGVEAAMSSVPTSPYRHPYALLTATKPRGGCAPALVRTRRRDQSSRGSGRQRTRAQPRKRASTCTPHRSRWPFEALEGAVSARPPATITVAALKALSKDGELSFWTPYGVG